MKKTIISLILVVLLAIGAFSLTGCGESDEKIAKRNLEKLITAIQNKNHDGVKALFAKNKIADLENFDEKIDELLEYYEGEYVPPLGVESATGNIKEGNRIIKYQEIPKVIETTVREYRIAILWYVKDTSDFDNVGIWSLYIIKAEDDVNEFAYVGDGKWTNGINIATPRPSTDTE